MFSCCYLCLYSPDLAHLYIFVAGLLTRDCFLVFLLLFLSPCLNSPGLAEQLESEAEEGGEAREADTKTNLGISDFYK